MGIYNFGISVGKNVNLFTEGSIFLYQSSFGKLKYTGTYTLKKHTQNKSGLYDWVYWAEIVLSQREDYCIEIDIPSIDSFEYKLVGNVEEVNYTGRIITQKMKKEMMYHIQVGCIGVLTKRLNYYLKKYMRYQLWQDL